MTSGIRVSKLDASMMLSLIRQKGLLDNSWKVFNDNDFVYIPINLPFDLIIPHGIDHKLGDFQFPVSTSKKTSIFDILAEIIHPSLHHQIPKAFDIIGEIAVVDISEEILHEQLAIGKAILQHNPKIKTVFRKSGKVDGSYRIRSLEHIAGINTHTTIHREHNLRFYVDVGKVYFSPRLATEHDRIARQVEEGERVYDMFCALSPFSLHILKYVSADILVVDLNPHVEILIEKSIQLNKQLHGKPIIRIGDAHEINMQLLQEEKIFDRIIMNHPSGSLDFISEAIQLLDTHGIIHLYLFAPVVSYQEYCISILAEYPVTIGSVHIVRQSSPSEYHLCLDLTHQ
ncbi:MAG: class I SAM-dependent methyltransferase family protein [Candidatus Heimdallarchaeota archaeon]|nr:class I SAM-dependent methyltransferase family protein [Candidatus Heimdallarchaeota archaeon]